jgi:Ti-type conjugative transfer relaxase TraA
MAIYHFHTQSISRGNGRSSTAAAAYRSGTCITDSRTGQVHDYTRKQDVIESAILLPEGAPEAFADRATLWNAVELSEKRKDSRTAREINISLPRELSDAQNWQLARDYVQKEFVDKGMIADVAFHRGHGGAGEEQPHMHVMLTTREVGPEGFGYKVREWNAKALLLDWRERWAETCNQRMAELGFDMRIDHRTLESQGINLEPHHYRNGMVDKRTGEAFAEYIEVARRNGERLIESPTIVLDGITAQQSTFSRHDVARFISRNSADKEQFDNIYVRVMASPELVALSQDKGDLDRFTTRELLEVEKSMVAIAESKAQTDTHRVNAATLQTAIDSRGLSDEQKNALRHITQGHDLAAVVGFAGTGKSYMLGAAKEVWENSGYRVQGMALSGIAAEGLEAGSGMPCNTIANRLWMWQHDREKLSHRDILVVDEAGMVGSRQLHAILTAAEKSGAKVILVGDPEQLQAIDAGAAFRAITERVGFAEMSDIRRQKEEWQKEATRDLALQRTSAGILAYETRNCVHQYETKNTAIAAMVERWDENRGLNPNEVQIMLAYTRVDVKSLNESARAIRSQQGELGKDHTFTVERGERQFAEGDRLYFLKNENKNLLVKNGTLATLTKIEGEQLTVRLDGVEAREVSFNIKDYNDVDHGYAATVHKSQGITVDRTQVLASKHFDRHTSYVAMSRHKDSCDIYYSKDEFANTWELTRGLSRDGAKDVTVDYALRHNVDIEKIPSDSFSREANFVQKHREVNLEPMDDARRKQAEERLKSRASEARQKVQNERHKATLEAKNEITAKTPEECAQQAKQRIVERQFANATQRDLARLEAKKGLSISMDLQAGEKGIYRGTYEIAGRSYGLIEKEEGQAKLILAERLQSREIGKEMQVQSHQRPSGKEELRGVQPHLKEMERQKTREPSRDNDLGLSF